MFAPLHCLRRLQNHAKAIQHTNGEAIAHWCAELTNALNLQNYLHVVLSVADFLSATQAFIHVIKALLPQTVGFQAFILRRERQELLPQQHSACPKSSFAITRPRPHE